MTKIFKQAGSEKGNALFLILIAVALFAALSYAVTQSGRGSGTIDKENAAIAASQVTQYNAALRTTITRLILTGTAANTLDFVSTSSSSGVFSSTGGGAISQAPPTGALTGTAVYHYISAPDSTGATGWYVAGVGTDTIADVVAYLPNVTSAACIAINRGLGVGTAGATPSTQATAITFPATNEGTTTQTTMAAKAAGNTFSAYSSTGTPVPFACYNNGTSGSPAYVYYHTLAEQ